MANPTQPDHGADEQATPPGMPRWVKILGVVAIAVIAVLVAVMLIAGGDHGPGRHGAESSAGIAMSVPHWG